jgi:hypothetical protein
MRSRLLLVPVAALALALAAHSASAANIFSLTSDKASVNVGDTFTITLSMDFSEGLLGAGLNVNYDDGLVDLVGGDTVRFGKTSPAPTEDTIPAQDPTVFRFFCFEGQGASADPGCANPGITVADSVTYFMASFNFNPQFTGIRGQHVIGQMDFVAAAAGVAVFSLSPNQASGGIQPFSGAAFIEVPVLQGTQVVTPEPGTALLLTAGLGALAWRSRRR